MAGATTGSSISFGNYIPVVPQGFFHAIAWEIFQNLYQNLAKLIFIIHCEILIFDFVRFPALAVEKPHHKLSFLL